jgi:regulation of enolase protein 1 (concanavalin A-like superfamily)
MGDEKVNLALPGISFTRSLNQAARSAKVEGGMISLASEGGRDNFRDPDGKLSNNTAPVLLAEVDNAKSWTLSGLVTPSFNATYDAGTFYIWVDDAHWLKMAMERDERGRVRIVSVRTNDTSDDNNHDVVTAPNVWMKISSDTKTVGFYYSTDQKSWQLIRLFKNDYPQKLWVGVSAQSPQGKGSVTQFRDLTLTKTSISDFRLGL